MEFILYAVIACAGWWVFLKYRKARHTEGSGSSPVHDGFPVYYCASKLRGASDDEMPEQIAEILLNKVSTATQIDVDVFAHAYRQLGGRATGAVGSLAASCRLLLTSELQIARSIPAIRQFVARLLIEGGDELVSRDVLDAEMRKLDAMIAEDPLVKRTLTIQILRANLLQLFHAKHRVSIEQFDHAFWSKNPLDNSATARA